MRPEQHIILKLIRGEPVDSLEGLDASVLIDLIRRHRLFPVAEGILKHLKDPERADLKQRIQNWSIKSLHLSSVLNDIFNEFTNSDIEALSLKGPVLTAALYGDVAKRSYNDIDILVDRSVMWESVDVLRSLGFRILYPREQLTQEQWNYYFKYKKEIGLVHKTQKSYIELHVGVYIHELLKKSEESVLLEDLVEEVIYDARIKTLNKENTFLYIAYHGAYHLYNRLFWLRDVAEAIKRWKLDHAVILEKARRLGIDRLLGVSILLAEEYAGSAIPAAYRDYLIHNKRVLHRLTKLCKKRIAGREVENLSGKFLRNRYFLMLKPGFSYRWTVLKSIFHRWYIQKFMGGH